LELLNGSVPIRELARVSVVGRKEAVKIFEPMVSGEFVARADDLRIFAGGLEAFSRGRFAEAEAIFVILAGRDPAARAYIAKCRSLIEEPPKAWNGVWVVTVK
jgi:adenylate cyclase